MGNQLAKEKGLNNNNCIVVLQPPAAINTGRQGSPNYHYFANIPYICSTVSSGNLTVQDTANSYAKYLSHELAEMICDPNVEYQNQEVCDPCAGNCGNSWWLYFDINGSYIIGVQAVNIPGQIPNPGVPSWAYFINGIVKPYTPLNVNCLAPGVDPIKPCNYPPPFQG